MVSGGIRLKRRFFCFASSSFGSRRLLADITCRLVALVSHRTRLKRRFFCFASSSFGSRWLLADITRQLLALISDRIGLKRRFFCFVGSSFGRRRLLADVTGRLVASAQGIVGDDSLREFGGAVRRRGNFCCRFRGDRAAFLIHGIGNHGVRAWRRRRLRAACALALLVFRDLAAGMILEAAARTPERIIDGKADFFVAFITPLAAPDRDVASVGEREVDVELMLSRTLARLRAFDDHPACACCAVALRQFGNTLLDRAAEFARSVHPLEINRPILHLTSPVNALCFQSQGACPLFAYNQESPFCHFEGDAKRIQRGDRVLRRQRVAIPRAAASRLLKYLFSAAREEQVLT
ncbi:MAG: hypothetical protein R3D62_02155 [Xanthobacteraceae bacterium]